MLLLFTIVVHFLSMQICKISCNASSAVSAQITLPPFLLIFDSNISSCLSSVSIAFHFRFFAFSRARCKSVNCCLPAGTTALYLEILKLIFLRCSLSADFIKLFIKKSEDLSDIIFYFYLPHQNVLLRFDAVHYKNRFQTF